MHFRKFLLEYKCLIKKNLAKRPCDGEQRVRVGEWQGAGLGAGRLPRAAGGICLCQLE